MLDIFLVHVDDVVKVFLRSLLVREDVLQRRAPRQLATGERCASEACPSTAGDRRKMCFRGVPFDSWRQETGRCVSEACPSAAGVRERCVSEVCPSTAGVRRREHVLQRRALRQLATGEGKMCFRGVPFDSRRQGNMCFRGVPFDSWRQGKSEDVLERRALRQLATGERCASEACPSTAGDRRREDVLQRRALRQLATGKMCFRGVPFDSWRQEKGRCASEACPSTAGDREICASETCPSTAGDRRRKDVGRCVDTDHDG